MMEFVLLLVLIGAVNGILSALREPRPAKALQIPDPIEIEARRLAEQEMNEFCSLFEEALGLVPTPPRQRAVPAKLDKIESIDHSRNLVPVLLKGKPVGVWEAPESYCLGCNEWTKEAHFHQFNMMGECVF